MTPHRFEPLAAVAGAAVIAVGALVAGFGVERVDPAVTVAGVAGALGLAVLPWRGARRDDPSRHDDMT